MPEAQGVVEKVFERRNQNGPNTFSLAVNEDGNTNWYGFYRTRPDCNEGDTVKLSYTTKGDYRNAKSDSLVVVSSGGGQASAAPAKSANSGGYTDNRQDSIVMQSSSKVAADLLKIMVDSGAVQFGKLSTKAAQAKAYDALLGLHADITHRVFNRCTKPRDFLAHLTKAGEDIEVAEEQGDEDGSPEEFSDY